MSKTPVSTLQEYMAKKSLPTPVYEIIASEGYGTHQPSFTYRVRCGNNFATGTASTKKEAKHNAAREFLCIHKDSLALANATVFSVQNMQTHSYFEPGFDGSTIFVNTVGKLGVSMKAMEHCTKFNLKTPIYDERNVCGPAHNRIFTIICSVGHVTAQATASTKKQAKHDAAQKMLQTLMNISTTDNGLYKDKKMYDCEQEVTRKLQSFNLLDLQIEQPKIPVGLSMELAKQVYTKLRQQNSGKTASNLEVKAYHRALKESWDPAIREKMRREIATIPSCTKQGVLDRVSKLCDTKVKYETIAITALGSAVCCKLDSFPRLGDIGIGVTVSEAREKAIGNLLKTIDALLI